MREVANAAPDGYTLGVASTAHVVSPMLQANPPYKPLADFTPIAQLTALPFILVAAPTVQAKNLPELVSAIKAAPKKYNFGSLGNGTAPIWALKSSTPPPVPTWFMCPSKARLICTPP